MKEFWDNRYNCEEFIYGKYPSEYLIKSLQLISPGKILFPAEGEGRNAVYASAMGWDVTAFDISPIGKNKALVLAREFNTQINYHIKSVLDIDYPENSFDCIASFFMHLPVENKKKAFNNLISVLNSGGIFIFEAFSKDQIKYSSGGPGKLDMLYNIEELESMLNHIHLTDLREEEVLLNNGNYHKGKAKVIRAVGIKK